MMDWAAIGTCVYIMVKVSEIEGRRPLTWGAITFALCFLCYTYIPLPILNIVFGLFLAYAAMFVVKLGDKW